jgi:uncharacterized protein
MAQTALVTGASSGIGRALAHRFAKERYNIIAVARDPSRLDEAAQDLRAEHGVEVQCISTDLTQEYAPRDLYDKVRERGVVVDVLVNDAGVGQGGNFAETSLDKELRIIRLNIEALVILTKLFIADMVQRNRGKILNLGSVAGFQPGPRMAVYHASKAFVVSFSEALQTELKDMDTQVTLTCLCPGPTATHFFERAGMEDTRAANLAMDPAEVADGGFKALMDGERIYIPGAGNKLMTFTRRVIPTSLQARINKKLYESSEEG